MDFVAGKCNAKIVTAPCIANIPSLNKGYLKKIYFLRKTFAYCSLFDEEETFQSSQLAV